MGGETIVCSLLVICTAAVAIVAAIKEVGPFEKYYDRNEEEQS